MTAEAGKQPEHRWYNRLVTSIIMSQIRLALVVVAAFPAAIVLFLGLIFRVGYYPSLILGVGVFVLVLRALLKALHGLIHHSPRVMEKWKGHPEE